jgi:dolichol-phosphate mannosyltransferase
LSTVWLVLPAYNEERSLPPLLERCIPVGPELAQRGFDFKVIVVDDGSKDGTIAAAKKFEGRLAIEVVPHVVNRGWAPHLHRARRGSERAADGDVIAA